MHGACRDKDDILSYIGLIIIGLLSGIISGMGIGGGVLLIPALAFFFGTAQQQAQNINLIYFIPTAIIALITHIKAGNIEKKIVLKLILTGAVGAVLGALLAVKIDSGVLRKLFGGFLLIMGAAEAFKKEKQDKSL